MNKLSVLTIVWSLGLGFGLTEAQASVNAADYGVSSSNKDNAGALQRAFDAARNDPDRKVILPGGNIAYGHELRGDGIKISGSGSTVLEPTNNSSRRILLTGNGPSISNVLINPHPAKRGNIANAGVMFDGATNFSISGVVINGAAFGTPPKGLGAGGIFIRKSTHGTIENNRVSYSLADSIHVTGGSHDITVTGNRVDHSLDDSIAVVNYQDGTGDVRIIGNTVTDNLWGRGITSVGGSNVQIQNNVVSGNAANLAGIYIASEASYGTAAPSNVQVEGNTVQNTGGTGPGHGQIMLYSGAGPLSNISVRNNQVRNSEKPDLAIVLSGRMNGVTLEGNQIDGRIGTRNGAGYNGSNSTNNSTMANGVPVPAPAGGGSGGGGSVVVGGSPGTDGSQIGQNLNNVERDLYATDDKFWNAVQSGDAAAMRRLNDLVSGGILFRQGNQIINRVTGQATSTVNRTIGDAVDKVISPVENTVSSLGDAILCKIGGGWISAIIGINVCAAKQLRIEGRQLETQRAMNAPGTADPSSGLQGMMAGILPGLSGAGLTAAPQDVAAHYGQAFPETFQQMQPGDLVSHEQDWDRETRNAEMAALQLQNMAVQAQAESLQRAADYANKGRNGPGLRAELEAGNAIAGEQLAGINALTAATVAHDREETAEKLGQKAITAASDATAKGFMSTLATCANCAINRPLMGN